MRYFAKLVAAVLLSASAVSGGALAAEPQADPWLSLRRFVGDWTGTATGNAGDGTVARTYMFVMNERFIHETNTSRYPPSEKNRSGEVHEHVGFFSYDKTRKVVVLRQFHIEGFVNTYRQAPTSQNPAVLVFDSESFENFSNLWKARETYEFLSDDEFIETFELAPPDKPFRLYSRNHLRRVKR